MRSSLHALPVALLLGFVSSHAHAEADLCSAKVIHSVGAVESPASMLTQGSTLEGITQLQVDKKTGMRSFCVHGGFCYLETVAFEDGKPVKALKLTNCTIAKKDSDDADSEIWSLDVNRGAIDPEKLRYADIDDKLGGVGIGMCNACADNATQFYIHKPDSKCGQVVRAALEGSPDAAKELAGNPDYCTWKY